MAGCANATEKRVSIVGQNKGVLEGCPTEYDESHINLQLSSSCIKIVNENREINVKNYFN